MAGGADNGSTQASAEAYDDTGAKPAWRPELVGVSPSTGLEPGSVFTVTGSRLRGLSEGSEGNSHSSPTNFPVLTLLDLARGRLLVRARDAAGNVDATPASHAWRSDAPPAAPLITSPANGATLDDNRPVISGTAQPGSTVAVTLDGSGVGTTPVDAAGLWTFTPASSLAEGPHTVAATASDSGGTSPASDTVRFTVDTLPDEPTSPGGGCACAAGSGEASWLLAGLALLAGVSRRRRPLA
ncbi:Ig-like domain-containing protein [Archangium sp.]|uniref:Ig-like domain-containing protein n=1 Tax=Archangium sp. TaxID=1872627 RepID=UPI00286ACDAC|nr:Ig-like domain-containing protein [Archangium sp.]